MSVRKDKVGEKDLRRLDELLPKNLGEKLEENLSSVTPEEKQLSNNENIDYGDLEKATNIKGNLQNIEERKKYASYIFYMVCFWLLAIMTIVILVGAKVLVISDAVLIALITSTTLNVVAFFVIVTKYLFPSNNSSQ